MTWIEPKTDWTNWSSSNEVYFNLDPDYARIKNNVLYIQEFSEKLNKHFDVHLEDYTIDDFPYEDFFNNIVESVRTIEENTYLLDYETMRDYVENGKVWNASDLNAIERNLQKVYNLLNGEYNSLMKLSFMLGVDEI